MKDRLLLLTRNRFTSALLAALLIHALIIVSVGFTFNENATLSQPLEVTLAAYKTKDKPKEADYLAQHHQEGSGTLKDKALPSTDNPAPFQDTVIRQVQPDSQPASKPVKEKLTPQIVTKAPSTVTVPNGEQEKPPTKTVNKTTPPATINLQEEIASLEAQFNKERQAYAKRPRVKRLTALSTLQEPGAFYKESWRRKVEKVGNINYPAKARQNHLYGELSLLVAINRDGSLNHVEIIKSSGFPILDNAAIRIVRLAAPYAPFGEDLKDYDQVEIIRTWRFEPGGPLFSG